jgi:hypothetical protein
MRDTGDHQWASARPVVHLAAGRTRRASGSFWHAVLVAMLSIHGAACFDAFVAADVVIGCRNDDDCPGEMFCGLRGVCLPSRGRDQEPPTATVVITPPVGRLGTVFSATLQSPSADVFESVFSAEREGVIVAFAPDGTLVVDDRLAEGVWQVRARLADGSGNVATLDANPITVDLRPPRIVEVTTNATVLPPNGPLEIAIEFDAPVSRAEVRATPESSGEDGPFFVFSTSIDTSDPRRISGLLVLPEPGELADGPLAISVVAADVAGNEAVLPASQVSIDGRPLQPLTTALRPSGRPVRAGEPVAITMVLDDDDVLAERPPVVRALHGVDELVLPVDVSNATLSASFLDIEGRQGTWSLTLTNLVDLAGNTTEPVFVGEVDVDGEAPVIEVGEVQVSEDGVDAVSIAVHVSEAAELEMEVDERVVCVCEPVVEGVASCVGELGDGPHVVRVRATDAAGNVGFGFGGFTLDRAPPAVTAVEVTYRPAANGLVADATALGVGGTALVNLVFDEPLAALPEVSWVGAVLDVRVQTGRYLLELSPPPEGDGAVPVSVRVQDQAGNERQLDVDVALDLSPPGAPDVERIDGLALVRAPGGAFDAPSAGPVVFLSDLRIPAGLPGVVEPGDRILVVSKAEPPRVRFAEVPTDAEGRFGTALLEPFEATNVERLFVIAVDAAGNASSASLVRNVEFVAGPNGNLAVTDRADAEQPVAALEAAGAVTVSPSPALLKDDGLTVETGPPGVDWAPFATIDTPAPWLVTVHDDVLVGVGFGGDDAALYAFADGAWRPTSIFPFRFEVPFPGEAGLIALPGEEPLLLGHGGVFDTATGARLRDSPWPFGAVELVGDAAIFAAIVEGGDFALCRFTHDATACGEAADLPILDVQGREPLGVVAFDGDVHVVFASFETTLPIVQRLIGTTLVDVPVAGTCTAALFATLGRVDSDVLLTGGFDFRTNDFAPGGCRFQSGPSGLTVTSLSATLPIGVSVASFNTLVSTTAGSFLIDDVGDLFTFDGATGAVVKVLAKPLQRVPPGGHLVGHSGEVQLLPLNQHTSEVWDLGADAVPHPVTDGDVDGAPANVASALRERVRCAHPRCRDDDENGAIAVLDGRGALWRLGPQGWRLDVAAPGADGFAVPQLGADFDATTSSSRLFMSGEVTRCQGLGNDSECLSFGTLFEADDGSWIEIAAVDTTRPLFQLGPVAATIVDGAVQRLPSTAPIGESKRSDVLFVGDDGLGVTPDGALVQQEGFDLRLARRRIQQGATPPTLLTAVASARGLLASTSDGVFRPVEAGRLGFVATADLSRTATGIAGSVVDVTLRVSASTSEGEDVSIEAFDGSSFSLSRVQSGEVAVISMPRSTLTQLGARVMAARVGIDEPVTLDSIELRARYRLFAAR